MLHFAFLVSINSEEASGSHEKIILLFEIVKVVLKFKKILFLPNFPICKLEAAFAWLLHINAINKALKV